MVLLGLAGLLAMMGAFLSSLHYLLLQEEVVVENTSSPVGLVDQVGVAQLGAAQPVVLERQIRVTLVGLRHHHPVVQMMLVEVVVVQVQLALVLVELHRLLVVLAIQKVQQFMIGNPVAVL